MWSMRSMLGGALIRASFNVALCGGSLSNTTRLFVPGIRTGFGTNRAACGPRSLNLPMLKPFTSITPCPHPRTSIHVGIGTSTITSPKCKAGDAVPASACTHGKLTLFRPPIGSLYIVQPATTCSNNDRPRFELGVSLQATKWTVLLEHMLLSPLHRV
eukprot:SAG31_NODE_5456_length_2526_cov_1.722291_2_plen_158_part_00